MSQSPERPVANDEIDLFELFENIWQQKIFILIITVCCSLAGAWYAFSLTPSYESTTYLLPPTQKHITELSKLNSNSHSRQTVFHTFLVVLQSNAAKQIFFNRGAVKSHYTKTTNNELTAWKIFNKALSIHLPKDGKSSVNVKFQTDNPELSALWANEYVDLALELTRNQLVADLQEEIQSRISKIDLQIENRSALFASELDTELSKLREALSIAQALNLNNPLQTDSIINQKEGMMVDEVRKLYQLGAHALKAEITAISKRLENRDFIPGLAGLNQQRGLLAGIEVNAERINPAQIDLSAIADEEPIKPKKAIIIVVATMLGIMAAVVIALIRMAIHNRRLSGSEE